MAEGPSSPSHHSTTSKIGSWLADRYRNCWNLPTFILCLNHQNPYWALGLLLECIQIIWAFQASLSVLFILIPLPTPLFSSVTPPGVQILLTLLVLESSSTVAELNHHACSIIYALNHPHFTQVVQSRCTLHLLWQTTLYNEVGEADLKALNSWKYWMVFQCP